MIGQYQSGGLLVAHTPPSHYYRMKLKHTPGFRSRRLIARAPALEPVVSSYYLLDALASSVFWPVENP